MAQFAAASRFRYWCTFSPAAMHDSRRSLTASNSAAHCAGGRLARAPALHSSPQLPATEFVSFQGRYRFLSDEEFRADWRGWGKASRLPAEEEAEPLSARLQNVRFDGVLRLPPICWQSIAYPTRVISLGRRSLSLDDEIGIYFQDAHVFVERPGFSLERLM